jgi:hypothetical protein
MAGVRDSFRKVNSNRYSKSQIKERSPSCSWCAEGGSGKPVKMKVPLKLEQQLTIEKLRQFEREFREVDIEGRGYLTMQQFRQAVRNTIGESVTDEESDMVFMKVDIFCDLKIDWEVCVCVQSDSIVIQTAGY